MSPDLRRNMSSKKSRKELDIAFFYADPLYNPEKDTSIESVSFDAEFKNIIKALKKERPSITCEFSIANAINLAQILSYKPKIIHFACHGAYEESTK